MCDYVGKTMVKPCWKTAQSSCWILTWFLADSANGREISREGRAARQAWRHAFTPEVSHCAIGYSSTSRGDFHSAIAFSFDIPRKGVTINNRSHCNETAHGVILDTSQRDFTTRFIFETSHHLTWSACSSVRRVSRSLPLNAYLIPSRTTDVHRTENHARAAAK